MEDHVRRYAKRRMEEMDWILSDIHYALELLDAWFTSSMGRFIVGVDRILYVDYFLEEVNGKAARA